VHLEGLFIRVIPNASFTSNAFTNNSATSYQDNSGWGGGMMIYGTNGGLNCTLTQNTFTNNTSNMGAFANAGYAGAILIDNGAAPIINRCNLNANTAENGGALFIDGASDYQMTNCILYNNNATNGGGIYTNNHNPANYLNFNNVIANNTATNGGGLYCQNSDPRFLNVIIWGNTATAGNNVYLNDGGSDPYFNYCDVEGGIAAFAGGGAGGYDGGRYTNNIELDPQFINAGGGDFNITKPTSPCIGAGNPATVTGDFPADEDYAGDTRVRGVVDIGAFETNNAPQFVTLPYPPLTDNAGPENVVMDEDATPTAFALNLSALDIDDENITWSISTPASNGIASVPGPASTGPPWAVTKAISYVPNADYNGTDMFVVRVSDGTLTDEITVNVTINSINDPPSFVTTPASLSVKSGQTWTYNIATTDPDHALNTLTLTCLAKPAAMVFSLGPNGTGTLTWTPIDGDVSPPDHTITLQVSDPAADFEQQTFDLNIFNPIYLCTSRLSNNPTRN
jgi:hypothetical protein